TRRFARVPDLHLTWFPGQGARRGEVAAVWAECHAGDRFVMPAQRQHLLPDQDVPDFHGVVCAGRGEPPTVAAERHAADCAGVTGQPEEDLPWGRVPDGHGALLASGSQELAIRAERHPEASPGEGRKLLARLDVPDLDFVRHLLRLSGPIDHPTQITAPAR